MGLWQKAVLSVIAHLLSLHEPPLLSQNIQQTLGKQSLPINSSWDFSFICSTNLSCQQICLLSSSLPPVPSEEINCKPCNWLLFPHSGTDQKGTGIFSCRVISIKCWLSQLSKEMAVPAKSVFWEVANRAWITSPSWLVGVSTSTSETSHFPEEATGKKSG